MASVPTRRSVCPPVRLSALLSVCLPFCLSVCPVRLCARLYLFVSKDILLLTLIRLTNRSTGVGTLPPGLGSSREKQDPWKEHQFQRRVRSLHSLETFGNPDGDDDDDDEEDEKWTRSYLSHHHVGTKRPLN